MAQYELLDSSGSPRKCTLNKGTDDELAVSGYVSTLPLTLLYYFLAVVSLGSSLLLFSWKPSWKLKMSKVPCSLAEADTLLLKNIYNEQSVESVVKERVSRSFPREFVYSTHPANASNGSLPSDGAHSDRSHLLMNEGLWFRYFVHHHIKYYWDETNEAFVWLRSYDINTPCNDFLEKFHGLTTEQQLQKAHVYGVNSIDVEVKSYFKLFSEEVMNPFYIFQIFSVCLWFADDYIYFSACLLVITLGSMAVSLYEIRRQSKVLHEMVSAANAVTVQVKRNGESAVELPSRELVPGDVIVIPTHGCIMSCDAVLITGSCIVNESMLTGESVPVMKTNLPHQDDQEIYSPDHHKRHTLFSGTHVIQTRYYGKSDVTAVVVRTGFSTAKGELVRSILFPRPMGFKFYRDSMRFIVLLFFVALGGIIYSLYIYSVANFPINKMIIRILDIVTIVVPPSLPAAMTVGSVYAQNRLRKEGIFCISPPRINVCGKLKMFCFDKTGTLTEEGLDLWGIVPVEDSRFLPVAEDCTKLGQKMPIVAAMATCHSLTMIEGELRGDPLDLKMFEATTWEIEEPGEDTTRYDQLCPVVVFPREPEHAHHSFVTSDPMLEIPYEIGILRQFTFSSNLQRMSVITRTLGQHHMNLYAKGAPEKIVTLCKPETVPDNFTARLEAFAVQGYRVIAVAWRELDPSLSWHQAQRIKRNDVEQELTFLGFLVMQNTLKPETTPVIRKLRQANIRTLMATGDNMHTAISVARECNMVGPRDKLIIVTAHLPEEDRGAYMEMEYAERGHGLTGESSLSSSVNINVLDVALDIDCCSKQYHFAMTGRTFMTICGYFPDLVQKMVIRGTIFARMSPEQKAHLVKELQEVGYIVGMCGDGANDCGALKMADVGISLSEAEASVAAPFTSKIPNIECVPIVIKEGRCALVTSFGIFKYMALYSMIQFVSVLILYTYKTNLGDQQFLYIDLALATVMAVVMGYTKPYDDVVKKRPHGSLVSPPVIVSVVAQVLLVAVFQLGAIFFLTKQPWYVKVDADFADKFTPCWEANVVFSISTFQYVITALVFSTGPPFRQPFYTNFWMVLSVVVLTAFNYILLLHPFSWLSDFFELVPSTAPEQFKFRLWLASFPLLNFILSVIIEVFTSSQLMRLISRFVRRKKEPKNRYKVIDHQLDSDSEWPSIGKTFSSSTAS